MISNFLNHDTVKLKVKAADKAEAIKLSAQPLIDLNKIKPEYVDDIFAAMEKFGPYIVLIPGIALAHAAAGANVNEECLSMITLSEPVVFGHETNDPVKTVFCLGSPTPGQHVDVLMKISKFLGDDNFIELLDSTEDVQAVLDYLIKEEGGEE